EFFRLLVAPEGDGGVFLDDAGDRGAELVLVAARLRLDGERDRGLGVADVVDRVGVVFRGQRVTGVDILQLRDGADVAGVKLRYGGLLFPLAPLQFAGG